jgi:hypothetical protein
MDESANRPTKAINTPERCAVIPTRCTITPTMKMVMMTQAPAVCQEEKLDCVAGALMM